MRVVLQPCGKDGEVNYLKTIKNNINLDDIKGYVTETVYNDLLQIYPTKEFQIWGTKTKNKSRWNKMSPGDLVLFSGNGSIYESFIATYKIQNEELALFLWGKSEKGEIWDCIYFLSQNKTLNISYPIFNRTIGWSKNKPDKPIQGFTTLDKEKSAKMLDYLSYDEESYEPITEDEYSDILKKEEDLIFSNKDKKLEKQITTFQRKEQAFLRKRLIGNQADAICSICGKKIPVGLIWCAHIKKRSSCTEEEKRDWKNIVTLMCKFGCDDLYEKGYIGVSDGKIIALKQTTNEAVNEKIGEIVGNHHENYNPNNKKYYDSHLERFK